MVLSRALEMLKRRWRVWLVFFLLLILALWAVLGIYFLFYPLGVVPKLVDYPPGLYPKPCVDPEVIVLEGPTLFIADLHIIREEDSSRLLDLAPFISINGVGNLVIVGDFFDSPADAQRLLGSSSDRDAVQVMLRLLGLNGSSINLYFLRGSEAHDPKDFDLNWSDGLIFKTLGECARFSIDGVKVIALHGDDAFGGLHGFIFSYLTGRPYLEAWWKDVMGLDDAEWVFMAHSHMQGIDYSRRVANTGGWTELFGFGPPRGMGILVAEGEVNLMKIKG